MSVGFGFSVGDFIAAIELVSTVIDALRESGDASSEYREVVRQLYTLETALLRVKRLEVDPTQTAEVIALQQAAAQCQRTIDDFWKKVQKYQPHLRAGGSSSRLKDGWMKIKWAVCKKEDVAKFKADLVGHTESIQLLLMVMQMGSATIHGKRQDQQNQTLSGKVQESYFSCMQRLSTIAGTVQIGIEQGKRLLEMTTRVLQTNIQVFQVVLDIQKVIKRIPGQVERQQPALVTFLKVNFKRIGSAAEVIERGDFAIQDSITKKDVNLASDWDVCFSPGQRVEISMVFKRKASPTSSCPTCKTACLRGIEEDIECQNCGLIFRRVENLDSDPEPDLKNVSLSKSPSGSVKPFLGPQPPLRTSRKRKRGNDPDDVDELSLFRRIRIYTKAENLIDDGFALADNMRVEVYELRNSGWFTAAVGFISIYGSEHFRTLSDWEELLKEADGCFELKSAALSPGNGNYILDTLTPLAAVDVEETGVA
ncbi:hypothetical protein G7Y89_g6695 [Cudoniella acicularis]|uniref:Azaphilone pigments biosynthesis cluster protein L N-terminal domain-containing protein n=1 Tax=Cudoniella acicularis TaxID=354080 RepID=A0A8H4RM69_9HELO|nr:hypothetical protein G7Y89_g6695 [Cudoniella acicularis]